MNKEVKQVVLITGIDYVRLDDDRTEYHHKFDAAALGMFSDRIIVIEGDFKIDPNGQIRDNIE